MANTHTPGPWPVVRQLDYDGSSDTTFVERIGPFHIEWHDDLNNGKPERIESDIALFAAAPDLLAALRGLIRAGHSLNSRSHEWNAVHAAISKATGEQQ